MARAVKVPVLVEQGRSRCFVRALDWPGWCRTAKTEAAAIEMLSDYAERYAVIAHNAGAGFPRSFTLDITSRAPGTATTDFGAPDARCPADHEPLLGAPLDTWIALLRAAWDALDTTAAVSSEILAKGPRGGGRDRTKLLAHVIDAERAYAPKIGVRWKPTDPGELSALGANRDAIVAALHRAPPVSAWPIRYWIHRESWHVLDHTWEMQDKQTI